jgi:MSHA type pilus biogenesis protein MshL
MKGLLYINMALVLLLSGCTHVEKAKEQPLTALRPVEIMSPVMPQMEKAKKIEIEGPKELFSFSLRDADIKDILRAISKQTNYNVVVEPDVKGGCTVDLKNVTLRKALEYILDPLNYTFKIEDHTIYVSKPKIETRIFSLNYIALIKTGKSTLKGTTGTERSGTGTGTSGTTSSGGGAQSSTAIEMKSDTDSDFWKNIEENVKSLLSQEGKYAINRQASTIVVVDYPKNINSVSAFIEAVEGSTQRQVMIEAKIIEVTLSEESQQGINWALIQAQWGNLKLSVEQALVTTQTKYFNIPNITTLPTAPPQYFRFGIGSGKFDSFIDLLKTQGKLSIVSSPRVATLNNQRAVIKVATEDVYFESSTTQTSGVGSQSSLVPRFITIGLILDVIPQIDVNGNIVMNIHPVLTEKVREVSMPVSVGGSNINLAVPVLAVREVDTLVKIKEGESVVIGGLISEKTFKKDTGVKGLMDVPIIGNFFKNEESEKNRTELVIFLIPRVVYGKD